MTTKVKPSFIAYAVSGEKTEAYWTRIGTAWQHKSGDGFNIELSAIPVNGRIVLMRPKADATEDAS